jgi:mRNA interferase RelE/StbE
MAVVSSSSGSSRHLPKKRDGWPAIAWPFGGGQGPAFAARQPSSVSEVVNEAVRLALAEDAENLPAFTSRAKEPVLDFEKVVRGTAAPWQDMDFRSSGPRSGSSRPSLKKSDRQRLVARIEGLAESPPPAGYEKLACHSDRYRVRQGDYRVVYSIDDAERVFLIVKVDHRREVYR